MCDGWKNYTGWQTGVYAKHIFSVKSLCSGCFASFVSEKHDKDMVLEAKVLEVYVNVCGVRHKLVVYFSP